jgi:hypothetical protein
MIYVAWFHSLPQGGFNAGNIGWVENSVPTDRGEKGLAIRITGIGSQPFP